MFFCVKSGAEATILALGALKYQQSTTRITAGVRGRPPGGKLPRDFRRHGNDFTDAYDALNQAEIRGQQKWSDGRAV
jgi:hypothetical protein